MSAPTPTIRSLSFSYRKFGAILIAIGLLSAVFGYSLASILIQPQNTASLSSSAWTPAASMNVARSFSAFATLHNGSLLVAGGFAGAVVNSLISSAELYSPNTNKWTLTAPMHVERAGALAVTLKNGEVLVTGGLGAFGPLTSCELYDPVTNTWTMTGNMTQPRFDHQIILLNDGSVFVAGGDFSGGENNVTETYSPSTGTWKTDAPQSLSRADMIAVKLPNGNVLVAGGHTSKVETLLSAIYNPVANNWTETGPLNTPHGDAGGVLLNNKAVLIVGGYTTYNDADNTIQYLYTSEIFNITSSSWKMTGDMNLPRGEIGLNIVRLGNGEVPGGNYQPEKGQSTAEIYNPTNGTWSMAGTMSVAHGEGAMSTLLTTGKALVFGGLLPHTCTYCGSGVTGQDLPTTAADLYTPSTTTTTSQNSGTGLQVMMPNGVGTNHALNYSPDNITVVIGVNNTVTWINSDTVVHTVTSQSVPPGASSFNSGNMNAGAKFTFTFTVPGTYTYVCVFHFWMTGTVIVVAS